MNLLAVDDDRFVLEALRTGMDWKELGFQQVFCASNIGGAKKILEEENIDLLISDIDMPGGTGLDLIGWLRGRHDDITVIFLTDYADFSYAQQAVALKTFQYMLKPIDFMELEKVVRDAMKHTKEKRQTDQFKKNYYWYQLLWRSVEETVEDGEAVECMNAPKVLAMSAMYFYPYVVKDHSVSSVFEDEDDEFMVLNAMLGALLKEQGQELLFFLRDPGHAHTYALGMENKDGAYWSRR